MNARSSGGQNGVRQRILEAALDEFYASGFHAATMRNIAKSAGCSAANVYNHFDNKAEILVEILRSASDAQFTATRNAVRKAGSAPVDRWRAGVVAHALYAARNQRACLVAYTELRYLDDVDRKRVVGSRDAQEHVFVEILEEGVASGDFHVSHVHQAVTAVLTMCAGIALWFRPDGALAAQQVAELYGGYALDLVGYHRG
ncbi:MAG TPA: TetR/AcrR family transcriptional regulator [Aldersonia sp.]